MVLIQYNNNLCGAGRDGRIAFTNNGSVKEIMVF